MCAGGGGCFRPHNRRERQAEMRAWIRDRGLVLLEREGIHPRDVERELPAKFQRR